MKHILETLTSGNSLSREESKDWMRRLTLGEFTDIEIAGALMALKTKGETAGEIAGFAEALRSAGTRVNIDVTGAVDCCGTGGDGSGSFNISTAAGIVAAGAGVKIAKHGNRSVSSRCGSADLLEGAGVAIASGADVVESHFREVGICFMFAPLFHPAIKFAMPARKALGVRTVFNMLGPLLNPAGVRRQLLGVYSRDVMRLFAETLLALGTERALVVHSVDGLDEISSLAETFVIELRDGALHDFTLSPEEIGVSRQSDGQSVGGGPEENLQTLIELLAGNDVPARPAVLANAGAVAYLAGQAESIADGVALCERALDSGACRATLDKWKRMV